MLTQSSYNPFAMTSARKQSAYRRVRKRDIGKPMPLQARDPIRKNQDSDMRSPKAKTMIYRQL